MKKTILALVVGGLMAANALALDFAEGTISRNGYGNIQCPEGHELATYEQASDPSETQSACDALGEWSIAALAGGGAMGGGDYNCFVEQHSRRGRLGHALCVRVPKEVVYQRGGCAAGKSVDHDEAAYLGPEACEVVPNRRTAILKNGLLAANRRYDGGCDAVAVWASESSMRFLLL